MMHKVKIRGWHNGYCDDAIIYVDGPDTWSGRGVVPGSGAPFDAAQAAAGPSWKLTSAEY